MLRTHHIDLILISSLTIVVAAFHQHHHLHFAPITTSYHRNIVMATIKPAMSVEEEGSETNQPIIYRYESPFFSAAKSSTPPSALVILNTPIKSLSGGGANCKDGKLSGVLGKLWGASSYRICADGGANRLYDETVSTTTSIQQEGEERRRKTDHCNNSNDNNTFLPDLITGDLDSLRLDVRRYYETKGVSIIRVEDQNFHDLDVRSSSVISMHSLASILQILHAYLFAHVAMYHPSLLCFLIQI